MIRQVVNLTRPEEVETGMLLAVPRYRAYLVHDDTSCRPNRRILIGYPSLDAAAEDARTMRRAKMDAAAVERCDMAGYPWRNVHWADDLEDLLPS